MIKTRLLAENLYVLDEEDRVREFLIVGDKEALLMDTGFSDSYVYEAVRKITDLPVKLIMTHGDMDHTGGLADFGECYMHEGDWYRVQEGCVRLRPLREGDVFTCGGYRLETIEIIGHTYGSVAFVDWEKRLMFPGDSVQKDGPIYMFGNYRNLNLYIESQRKLCKIADRFDTLLPCHHDYPIDASYIEKNLLDAIALKNGELDGTKKKHPTMNCYSYQGKWTEFYYD